MRNLAKLNREGNCRPRATRYKRCDQAAQLAREDVKAAAMEPSQDFPAQFALRLGGAGLKPGCWIVSRGRLADHQVSLRHVPATVWLLSVLHPVFCSVCLSIAPFLFSFLSRTVSRLPVLSDRDACPPGLLLVFASVSTRLSVCPPTLFPERCRGIFSYHSVPGPPAVALIPVYPGLGSNRRPVKKCRNVSQGADPTKPFRCHA